MPTRRKNSAIGTPIRCDARLESTLTSSRMPQMVSRRAVAAGSLVGIGIQVTMRLAVTASTLP